MTKANEIALQILDAQQTQQLRHQWGIDLLRNRCTYTSISQSQFNARIQAWHDRNAEHFFLTLNPALKAALDASFDIKIERKLNHFKRFLK